jgi:hypothetical protein
MGGSGSPPLFGDSRNLFLYMQAYRGGGHSRVYGTSTNEIMQLFAQMEQTGAYRPPELTLRLRMKETYLYGTYKEKVFVPTKAAQEAFKETGLPPPIYEAGKAATDIAIGESRLLNAKLLIPRSQAEVELEKTRRNDQVIFGVISHAGAVQEMRYSQSAARRAFDGALSANTALCRMLERRANDTDAEKLMKDSFFRFSTAGERDFTLSHARWITDGAKSNTYDIRDLRRPEDMFVRTEVSTEENMKVSGIERIWVRKDKTVLTETSNRVGLWQVNGTMYQHAEETLSKLVEARAMSDKQTLDRSTVTKILYDRRDNDADDPLIIRKAVQDTAATPVGVGVLIHISTDRQLAKIMAAQTGKTIFRLAPISLIPMLGEDSEETIKAMDGNPALFKDRVDVGKDVGFRSSQITNVYVDTGSLQSALTKFVTAELPGRRKQTKVYMRRLIEVGTDKSGHRFEKIGLRPMVAGGSKLILTKSMTKDSDGHRPWEIHRPTTPVKVKVSRYESFLNKSEDDAQSERGSSFSLFSTEPDSELRTEEEFNFSPFLNPENMD